MEFITEAKKTALEMVHFRSQILEHPSIGEYWKISGVSDRYCPKK